MLSLPSEHEAIISNAFYGVLAVVCLWELVAARRVLGLPVWLRWSNNFLLGAIGAVLSAWLFPFFGVAGAIAGQERGIGLFNAVHAPDIVAVVVSLLLLDLAAYGWHRLSHAVPLLWRFHLVHHSDRDVDLATAFRPHPVEALLSAVVLLALIAALGAPPFAVFLFFLLHAVSGIVQHANVRIPGRLDSLLRLVFVTPDMHRVHHSAAMPETDSNFTMLFSFWDRMFGTYRPAPAAGHDAMTLGLAYLREPRENWLHRMLLHPFLSKARLFAVARN